MDKMFGLFVVSLLLTTTASASTATGPVKKNFVFGNGLKESYNVVVNLPSGLKGELKFGTLRVSKSFFEDLKFEMYSQIPENIGLNDKSWKVKDTTAKAESLFVAQDGEDYLFNLYCRIDPVRQPKVILRCGGSAKSKAVFDAMLSACRSAKLQ